MRTRREEAQFVSRKSMNTAPVVKSIFHMVYNTPLHGLASSVYRGYRTLTSPLRVLPDYLVLGSMRCGTTSLHNQLCQHPNVHPGITKEVHFFGKHFHKGTAWYKSHFPTKIRRALHKGPLVTGEASFGHLFNYHAPARAKKIIPSAKFIALVRNPIDRTFSQYTLQVKKGWIEQETFERALELEEERVAPFRDEILSYPPKECHYAAERMAATYSYLGLSRYAEMLKRWYKHFPKEQILVVKSEDLYEKPKETHNMIEEFLNIPFVPLEEYENFNPLVKREKTKKDRIRPETREMLKEYFTPHNKELDALVGREFGWW